MTSSLFALSRVSQRTLLSCRLISTSPRLFAAQTKGQAPDESRRPKERTHLDQNPHLKHAASSAGGNTGRDTGKGAAAPNPELPSHTVNNRKGDGSKSKPNHTRGLHTSGIVSADSQKGAKHTADSYFKDVDTSAPPSSKTHAVDADAAVQRPNEHYGDPSKDYSTVSKDEPYQPPAEENSDSGSGGEKGEQKEQKLGYGGTERDRTGKKGSSGKDSGPEKAEAGGRKPEGR